MVSETNRIGSDVPRILKSYEKECFIFTENFIRMTFPIDNEVIAQATAQVTAQATAQVKSLITILSKPMNRQEIQERLNLSHREHFRLNYLNPALELGLIEMTIPNKPNSPLQKYKLTESGINLKNKL